MSKRLCAALLLFVAMCMPALLPSYAPATSTVAVTDLGGRSVEVPANPQRIIALSPGTLRLIVALGAGNRVVGVEDFEKNRPTGRPYILAHPELAKLPAIGTGGPGSINKEPDLEAVLKLKPEVIFISYMEVANADTLQKKIGIPVVILSHGRFASFDELIFTSLRVAGKVLNKEQRAEEVIAFVEKTRKDLAARIAGMPESKRKPVYVGSVGYKGVQGIESTDAAFTPLEWAGGRNIAKALPADGHVFVQKEKLLEWNPPIIILDAGGLDVVRRDFAKNPEFYKGLLAFSNNNVYIIYPFNYYVTNIGTAMADSYALGRILYPDRFADIDVGHKADEIYAFLYGKPVYELMERDFGPLGRTADFVR